MKQGSLIFGGKSTKMREAAYFWLSRHRGNGKEDVSPKYNFALFVTNEHLSACLTMKLAKADGFEFLREM